jgi:hypothetical protein
LVDRRQLAFFIMQQGYFAACLPRHPIAVYPNQVVWDKKLGKMDKTAGARTNVFYHAACQITSK